MPYVLDTDIITAWQHKRDPVASRVAAIPGSDICVTIVSFEEQCAGRLAVLNKHLTTLQRIDAYQRLEETLEFYTIVTLLPYGADAAQREDELRALIPRMGTKDRRIAAIALTQGATLVTANTVHFASVPSLTLVDWTR